MTEAGVDFNLADIQVFPTTYGGERRQVVWLCVAAAEEDKNSPAYSYVHTKGTATKIPRRNRTDTVQLGASEMPRVHHARSDKPLSQSAEERFMETPRGSVPKCCCLRCPLPCRALRILRITVK